MMPYQSSCKVLWYPSPFTLSDEPLPCGVEHRALEREIGDAEFGTGLNNPVHC